MSSDGNGSVPRFDENGALVGYGCASCETDLEDFAVFDEALNLDSVIAKGEFCVKEGKLVKKGFFE